MKKLNTVGIDVSAKTLDVATSDGTRQDNKKADKKFDRQYDNTSSGHQKLIARITKRGRHAKVVLEATGTYSLGIALALDAHPRVEVMVANPRAMHNFGQANMQRGKNDPIDSRMILTFAQRMPFNPWSRPPENFLFLRGATRRVRQIANEITMEKNRLHSKEYEGALGQMVRKDIAVNIRHLEKRQTKMEEQAMKLVRADTHLLEKFQLLTSIKGIAQTSGLQILGELIILPEDMKPKQWVAIAGIDPRENKSGTSVNKPKRISKAGSKYLRAALYMPVMTAVTHDPHIRAFYNKLKIQRNKKAMVAQIAVMRKLLHAIWGMFHYKQTFDGEKFHPLPAEKRKVGQ